MAALLRAQWAQLRARRGRLFALAAAALLVLLFGLVPGLTTHSSCSNGTVEVQCPTDPVGPDGHPVSDLFFFAHQPLGERGGLTVRLAEMTGVITYPPPDHDEIVPGLVPWAKTGIMIKDGLGRGSRYAALVMTGSHGVRMQHDYVHDTPGRPGGVSAQAPRWLRLTRDGDLITGFESADGVQWTQVGTARLPGLPATAQVGLFATSPSDLTLVEVALGGRIGQARFTQATGVFDHVTLDGQPTGPWQGDVVGELGHTDWEKYHKAAGLVEADGTLTVTGSGDIGPIGTEGGTTVERTLIGLFAALIVLIVVAARFANAAPRPATSDTAPPGTAAPGTTPPGTAVSGEAVRNAAATSAVALSGRVLAARAVVLGGVVFLSGLVVAAVTVPVGAMLLRDAGVSVAPVSLVTGVRVVVAAAALLAVATVLALGLSALLRRAWLAIVVGLATVVLPYLLGAVPLLPDPVVAWMLRLTPAAGFAALQTVQEYPQVTAHYVPYAGYYPLPGWAGFGVLCGYAAIVCWLVARRLRRAEPAKAVDFR